MNNNHCFRPFFTNTNIILYEFLCIHFNRGQYNKGDTYNFSGKIMYDRRYIYDIADKSLVIYDKYENIIYDSTELATGTPSTSSKYYALGYKIKFTSYSAQIKIVKEHQDEIFYLNQFKAPIKNIRVKNNNVKRTLIKVDYDFDKRVSYSVTYCV